MLERLLIVGYGSIGKRHARLARQLLPDAEIMILRHKTCENMNYPDSDFCVTSFGEVIKFKPQAAVIANPATYHIDSALPLAELGIHLLIEKPIANTLKDVNKLIEICHSKGSILMVGYNLRYLSSLKKFRDMIKNKRIGNVLSVRSEIGQYLPTWRPDSDYRENVSANAELGGGVLLELSHDIDYLCWLFGEVEWVSAILSKQSELEIDVEDTAHLTFGFSSLFGCKPLIANLNMDCIRHDTTRFCMAVGETATLKWDALNGRVEILDQGESEWAVLFEKKNSRDDSYIAEWEHFLDCINNNESPLVSGQNGAMVLKVIEAARKSSITRCVVPTNNSHLDR